MITELHTKKYRKSVMERFAGKKWKDIEENDKKELLENAICRDCRVGSPLLNGEDMVAFLQKHL